MDKGTHNIYECAGTGTGTTINALTFVIISFDVCMFAEFVPLSTASVLDCTLFTCIKHLTHCEQESYSVGC